MKKTTYYEVRMKGDGEYDYFTVLPSDNDYYNYKSLKSTIACANRLQKNNPEGGYWVAKIIETPVFKCSMSLKTKKI